MNTWHFVELLIVVIPLRAFIRRAIHNETPENKVEEVANLFVNLSWAYCLADIISRNIS